MAKITLQERIPPQLDASGRNRALRERAKLERKHPTEAERLLQREINKSPWRWRRKRPWGNQIIDLWNSVLYLGVNIDGPGEAEWRGQRTLVLHFSQEEILGEIETVAQIVLAAAASQEALRKWQVKMQSDNSAPVVR